MAYQFNNAREAPSISGGELFSVIVAVVVLWAAYRASLDDFIPILDHANLAFHEAGHLFFGVLGYTMGLYGGTLGQLVFPVVAAVSFFRKGAIMPAALALLWFFQNFLNIARYAADARAQQLPLVGGGEHDWFTILYRWNALNADASVASALTLIAWGGMVCTVCWVFRVYLNTKKT